MKPNHTPIPLPAGLEEYHSQCSGQGRAVNCLQIVFSFVLLIFQDETILNLWRFGDRLLLLDAVLLFIVH